MFCPNCGIQATDDIKFCRKCGTNLRGVQALLGKTGDPRPGAANDWFQTALLAEELERRKGNTPEVKRLNEIRGGVITSSVGVGLMIFLYHLLGAVAIHLPPGPSTIVDNIWFVGFIPFMVGIALIINGLTVSKRIAKQKQVDLEEKIAKSLAATSTQQLSESEAVPYESFSVTEQQTYQLPQPLSRENQ